MKQGLIEHPNGTKHWYKDGKCHRLDGPAVEHPDGSKCWYIDGKGYTQQEYKEHLRKLALVKQANIDAGINTDF